MYTEERKRNRRVFVLNLLIIPDKTLKNSYFSLLSSTVIIRQKISIFIRHNTFDPDCLDRTNEDLLGKEHYPKNCK
jgi:hypothetical protein